MVSRLYFQMRNPRGPEESDDKTSSGFGCLGRARLWSGPQMPRPGRSHSRKCRPWSMVQSKGVLASTRLKKGLAWDAEHEPGPWCHPCTTNQEPDAHTGS